ncbi:hypothetical protein E3P99_02466 [Wallemia hederae]|uniref:Uncharacterized protein n=1 Tax=Wallemia hederae TaxID=1540922 RepID=A0A4T0FLQ5_9BASI|nr:hypothetical protein E3P99_02466 [Wallemia hederae]
MSDAESVERDVIVNKKTTRAEMEKWESIPQTTINQFRMFIVKLIRQTPPARSNDKYRDTLNKLFTRLSTSLESQLHELKVPPPPPTLRSVHNNKKFKPGWLFTTDSTVDLSNVARHLETKVAPYEDDVARLRQQLKVHRTELANREARLTQYTRTVSSLNDEMEKLEEKRVCLSVLKGNMLTHSTQLHPFLKKAFKDDDELGTPNKEHSLNSSEELIYQSVQHRRVDPIYDIANPGTSTYTASDDPFINKQLSRILPRVQSLHDFAVSNSDALQVAAEMRDIMESFYSVNREPDNPLPPRAAADERYLQADEQMQEEKRSREMRRRTFTLPSDVTDIDDPLPDASDEDLPVPKKQRTGKSADDTTQRKSKSPPRSSNRKNKESKESSPASSVSRSPQTKDQTADYNLLDSD